MINKKIAMLGMWGVGKTSLTQRFVNRIYDDKYLTTLGVRIDKKVVEAAGHDINLIVWDIAGAEDHFSVPIHYIKGAAGYLLVMDGTRRASLESAIELVKSIEQSIGATPFIAVVNKSDLEWELTETDITKALAPYNCTWMCSSAKTGENVELAFETLARKLV